ncbi:MAG: PQQ-binding-like beta-propeller repeat protein [Dehalococcoidia bacterium]
MTEMKACASGHSPAVFAVDRESGKLRWTFCPESQAAAAVVGATDKLVYATVAIPPGGSVLVALDAANGKESWRATTAASWTPGPFAGHGIVVIPFNPKFVDGRATEWEIAGLDADTGKVRWHVPANGSVPVANSEDIVIVGTDRSSPDATPVSGLDRLSGKERWKSNVRIDDRSGVGVARSPLAVTGTTVVVPSGNQAVGLNVNTGVEVWRSSQLDHPTGKDGVVVGGAGLSAGGTVQAVDASSGATLWSAGGRPSYGDIWALADGAAYVVREGVVAYGLRTGAERWKRDDVPEPWAAGDGAVYVGWERVVGALSAKDGTTRWMLQPALAGPSWMTGLLTNSRSAFIAANDFAPSD